MADQTANSPDLDVVSPKKGILAKVKRLLTGSLYTASMKDVKFVAEFFASENGEGDGVAVTIHHGEPPGVGEFISRQDEADRMTRHRVSKIQYVIREDVCIPWLICPRVTDDYYREVSDDYSDFMVLYRNADGEDDESIEVKGAIVPAVGSTLMKGDHRYDVSEHLFNSFNHILYLCVVANVRVPSDEDASGEIASRDGD